MGLSIISFTKNGLELSQRIAQISTIENIELYTKYASDEARDDSATYVQERIGQWAGAQMRKGQSILFIGACGIAIRAIAPHMVDKLQDSPVLVMDEKGQYVIPILAGHVGGANELAYVLAQEVGATPVITTATDIQSKFAVDLWAKKNGLHICNKEGIAQVSSKVLDGKKITMSIESGHWNNIESIPEGIQIVEYPPSQFVDVLVANSEADAALHLSPKEYVIGIGCRKGKTFEEIDQFIDETLQELGIAKHQIYVMASIEQKAKEQGLLEWSNQARIPFWTYTAERLEQIEGDFSESEFVRQTVGVDNVCERAALMTCGDRGELILHKRVKNGMTIAIAKREWRVTFHED